MLPGASLDPFLALSAPQGECAPLSSMDPIEHEFILHDFQTEGGARLATARLVYGTYGRLNAARDNVVLLPSHYMADLKGYEWLIGPERALDPERFFLVATELFGNGRSSSPSNTPAPHEGPNFPVMSIRDNVHAVHRMLTAALGVQHVRAVIGFSMGAQQAFQWAVSYPDFMDRIVATAGSAKTHPHGRVRLAGQIAALTADATFQEGRYSTPPKAGLEAFALVWTGWLFSQEWWRQELWRTGEPPGKTLEEVIFHYRTEFIPGADANDLIAQIHTWQNHDVGATAPFAGDLAAALASIKVPVLYMPSETDLYFPIGEARYESGFMAHCSLVPIPSLWGHTAGAGVDPTDCAFLNRHIAAFLGAPPGPPEPGA